MLKSSTLEEIQRYYQTKFRSMIVSNVMSFSVQNSVHAWREYTGMIRKINLTLVRFWYVFHWANWYSSIESKSCITWSFGRNSPLRWIPAEICAVGGNGRGNSFWGRFWLWFRPWVGLKVLLWFWLTEWAWPWVGGSFGGNFIWESKGSYHSTENFSTGARFKCTSEG